MKITFWQFQEQNYPFRQCTKPSWSSNHTEIHLTTPIWFQIAIQNFMPIMENLILNHREIKATELDAYDGKVQEYLQKLKKNITSGSQLRKKLLQLSCPKHMTTISRIISFTRLEVQVLQMLYSSSYKDAHQNFLQCTNAKRLSSLFFYPTSSFDIPLINVISYYISKISLIKQNTCDNF